jgi:hypothetical protein
VETRRSGFEVRTERLRLVAATPELAQAAGRAVRAEEVEGVVVHELLRRD